MGREPQQQAEPCVRLLCCQCRTKHSESWTLAIFCLRQGRLRLRVTASLTKSTLRSDTNTGSGRTRSIAFTGIGHIDIPDLRLLGDQLQEFSAEFQRRLSGIGLDRVELVVGKTDYSTSRTSIFNILKISRTSLRFWTSRLASGWRRGRWSLPMISVPPSSLIILAQNRALNRALMAHSSKVQPQWLRCRFSRTK